MPFSKAEQVEDLFTAGVGAEALLRARRQPQRLEAPSLLPSPSASSHKWNRRHGASAAV
jgi:hypothetical protein